MRARDNGSQVWYLGQQVTDLKRELDFVKAKNDRLMNALEAAREFIDCHPAVQGDWPILLGLIDDAMKERVW